MGETTPICARCGAATDAGHDFCPKCGHALRSIPPPVPGGPPPLPKKPFPLLPVVLCALAGIAILVAGLFFLTSDGPEQGATIEITTPSGSEGGASAGDGSADAGGSAISPLQEHPLSGTFHCRKGAEFDVDPEDAIFAIDDVVIGKVDDFDGKGGGRTYYFKGPGTYIARLSMKGYRTAWVKIVVWPEAGESVVSVDTELKKR